jgi:methylthioribose-1-phosphate isomerase
MPVKTIEYKRGRVYMINQRKLPSSLERIACKDLKCVKDAIKDMKIRGAPAIGIAAAFGLYLAVKDVRSNDYSVFKRKFDKALKTLKGSRPTAVNLSWALERIDRIVVKNSGRSVSFIKKAVLEEAKKIIREDKDICRKLAENGASLIKNDSGVLTHCNAGALATADFGTALGVLYRAKKDGKKIKVYVDETRPLLQGARLSAWELSKSRIDTTLLCDNMAADLMSSGKIQCVIVGADRIAANGDTANKIGTYNLAVLAKYHDIPFYVAAPVSSFDLSIPGGRMIPIEQRPDGEVRFFAGKRIAPKCVKIYNPAFDVTPGDLITAIITEIGIFRKPYRKSLKKIA